MDSITPPPPPSDLHTNTRLHIPVHTHSWSDNPLPLLGVQSQATSPGHPTSYCGRCCFSALLSFLYVWHCSSIRSLRVALSSLAFLFTLPLNLILLSGSHIQSQRNALTDVKIDSHLWYISGPLIREEHVLMKHNDAAVFVTLSCMNRVELIAWKEISYLNVGDRDAFFWAHKLLHVCMWVNMCAAFKEERFYAGRTCKSCSLSDFYHVHMYAYSQTHKTWMAYRKLMKRNILTHWFSLQK